MLTNHPAMASNFYRTADAPKYTLGHGLEIGFVVAGLLAVIGLRLNYKRINGKRAELVARNESFDEMDMSHKGDRAATFRYVL